MKDKQLGAQLGKLILSHKLLFFVFTMIFFGITLIGVKDIWFNSHYRYFFGPKNPQLIEFDKLQKVYSKEDSILMVITPESGNIFTKRTLVALEELTEKAWQVPYSTRVDSVVNFQHTEATGDDLVVRKLVEDANSLTEKDIEKIKTVALNEPLMINRLFTDKANVTAINISINLPGKHPLEVQEAAKFVRELAEDFKKDYPDHKTALTGLVMLNNNFFEINTKDLSTLVPLMYIVILIITMILLRSFFGMLSVLIVLLLSVLSGMGSFGWFGLPLTPPSSMAPTIILTLAVADSIHYLLTMFGLMKKGMSKKESIIESLRVNLQPIFITSFTTAIGFLSLNFSDAPPFHDLGNTVAFGVMCAFLYTIILVPILISILPIRVVKKEVTQSEWLDRFGAFVVKRRAVIAVSMLAITVLFTSQIPKIIITDKFVEYFDSSNQFRIDTEYTMKNLAGIYQIEWDLKANEAQGISDPNYLKKIEEFANWFRKQKYVNHVNVFTDIMKRLNKNMHSDKSSYYRVPENKDLAAQFLLLYEMSLPYGFDLNNQIDIEKSSTKMTVTLGDIPSAEMLIVVKAAENWLEGNAPPHLHAKGTSSAVMFSNISRRNIKSMVTGTLVAFILISLVMMIALKSLKYGLISLIPNLIPATIGFGIWTFFIGSAGFAISMVASVTIGIVVDDTVHFLTKYVRSRREGNINSEMAIRSTFVNVGPALTTTSIILVIGFSILTFSGFRVNWTMGFLSAITISVALIVDFLLLPAMLSFIDGKGDKMIENSHQELSHQKIK